MRSCRLLVVLLLAGTAFLAGLDSPAAQKSSPTTIVLVRHAEAGPPGPDPGLTDLGAERAEALAEVFRDSEIGALYASQFRRTADTLAPLAERLDQEVRVDEIARGDIESWARSFAARLLRDQAGRTVVVAGHSNTVPLLISALGVEPAPVIPHWQHDNLFVVTVSGGAARLLHMHYGATSAAEEP